MNYKTAKSITMDQSNFDFDFSLKKKYVNIFRYPSMNMLFIASGFSKKKLEQKVFCNPFFSV